MMGVSMSRFKVTLMAVLIVIILLTACNHSLRSDNSGSVVDTIEDTMIIGDGSSVGRTDRISFCETVVTESSSVFTEAQGSIKISEETVHIETEVEVSFENNISDEMQTGTKSNNLYGNREILESCSEETAVPLTNTQTSIRAESTVVLLETIEELTDGPSQTLTILPKTTEEFTTVVQGMTEALKTVYDPEYVITEITNQLKAQGYEYMPDYLDELLVDGQLTKESYERSYPTGGMGYFDYTCWSEDMEYNIYEIVEAQIFVDYFYIDYVGMDKWGGHIYRCYR